MSIRCQNVSTMKTFYENVIERHRNVLEAWLLYPSNNISAPQGDTSAAGAVLDAALGASQHHPVAAAAAAIFAASLEPNTAVAATAAGAEDATFLGYAGSLQTPHNHQTSPQSYS